MNKVILGKGKLQQLAMLKTGDLVVERKTKKSFIILEQKKSRYRSSYGSPRHDGPDRLCFLIISPDGRQKWLYDTELKVKFYLPGDAWLDEVS